MDTPKIVRQELHKIHRSRNRLGYFPNVFVLGLSIYFQRANLATDDRWVASILTILLGTILRILINEVFFTEWEKDVKWARVMSFMGFFLISLGWGLHFSDVYYHYGSDSKNVVYVLLVIAAFITGSSTSLIGDKVSFYTFISVMSSFVVGTYLTEPRFEDTFIIVNCVLYVMFAISNFKISYRQLCELLESKVRSNKEKDRLKNIINTVPGFVGLINSDLTCYIANSALLSIYPDIVGKKIGNLDPNSDWERYVIDFMNSERHSAIVEQKTGFKGRDIYVVMNIQKTEEDGAIIVSIDTTDLVEARDKIREQEAKAAYTSKLASLGEMAAGIAHEVNNPLTIIQGSANIVRRLVDKDPIDRESVKILTTKLIDTAERISKTVRSLKALSRNGENEPKEMVSVKSVIDQCVDISDQRIKNQDIDLRLHDVNSDLKFFGREVQISQVMINLLSNAVDAIKNLPERWIEIRAERKNACIDIYVTDSGLGIPPEIRAKIMDPFFTTKDVNQGTGLGLSISKSIVRDHGGELTLLPEAKNTTFRIRLPVAP